MTAAVAEEQPASRGRDLGVASEGVMGIVVNQTLTQNGYEFYRLFTQMWVERPEARNYSLSIREKLSKRYGNRMDVYLGQKVAYSVALPNKYDRLRAACEQAVEETQANLAALSLTANGADDLDIVREEM